MRRMRWRLPLIVVGLLVAQHLDRHAAAGQQAAAACRLHAVLPRAGRGRQRQGDVVQGRGDPGHPSRRPSIRRGRGGRPPASARSCPRSPTPTASPTSSQSKGVEVNARRRSSAAASSRTCSLSLLPTILLIGLLFWLFRRAAAGAAVAAGSAASGAPDRAVETPAKVTFDDVAGIDEAENELVEIVDFLKNPEKYQRLGGTHAEGRAAHPGRPAPARRCWRGRSPARRASRSFSLSAPSSSR